MRPEDLGIGRLFERVRDAVIVADAETQQIVLWNPAATNIFGYSLSEALDLRVEALVPGHLKARHRAGIARYAQTGHGAYIDSQRLLDLPALRKGGEEIRIELSLNPVGSMGEANGSGRFVLAIIRDITERKRNEEALREAEELFRSVFDNASVGVAVVDLDGRFRQVNRALCEILGYSEEELLGTTFREITHPEDLDTSTDYARQMLEGGLDKFSLEKRYISAGGEPVWVSLNVSMVRDSGGNPLYFVDQIQDITDRKRAEARLREAETRYRTIVENIPAAVYIQPAGNTQALTYISPQIEQILGYTQEELLASVGRNWIDLLHPDDRARVLAEDERTNDTGEPFREEYRQRTKDGRYAWIREESVLVRGEEGEPLYWQGFLWDITERKLVEEELRFRKVLLEAQREASIDGILVVSTDGKIASFNRRFVEMWGIPEEVISTRSDEAAVHAVLDKLVDPYEFRARIDYLYGHRDEQSHDEILLKDGRTFDRYSAPVRGEDGAYYGRVWHFRDITQRKLAEEEIRHLNETLEKRVAERTAQLAERETTLRDLLGKLVVAQEEERRRVAYEVHDGLAQMIVAVQQHLQAFARQHPPASLQGRESLDFNLELVQQTVEEARRVIGGLRPTALDDFGLAAAIRLEVEALRSEGWDISYVESLGDERLPPTLETALYRVTQEALTNVRKHADTTCVRLGLGRLGQEVRLRVRDCGKGFSEAEIGRAGGPGERIGISGMEERVALLGGEFKVRSRPGAGTLIVAKVPLADSEEDVEHG